MTKKLYVLSILLILLAARSPAHAFGSKRLDPNTSQGRESLWNGLAASMGNVRSDFDGVRQKIFVQFLNFVSNIVTQVKEARLADVRCSDDWLTTSQAAKERLDWAIRCLEPRTQDTVRFTPEEILFNVTVLSLLKDQQAAAAQGRAFKYPTFGNIDRSTFQVSRASSRVVPDMGSCKPLSDMPNIVVAGLCNPGCFAPEQLVLFSQGYVPVGDANITNTPLVVTMSQGSELDKNEFKTTQVDHFLSTSDDKRTTIVEIQTTGGYVLRVSQEHPILLSTGEMHRADKIKIGNKLLAVAGDDGKGQTRLKVVRVLSAVTKPYHGSYINLEVTSQEPKENIIIANGLLVGTNLYQTERGRDLLEKKLFQAMLPADVVKE